MVEQPASRSDGVRVMVRAVPESGGVGVGDWPAVELGHGETPAGAAARSARAGGGGAVTVTGPADVRQVPDEPSPTLRVDLRVRTLAADAPAAPVHPVEGPAAARFRRVAAYAVVVADERILLTQLSEATPAAGRWTLPGGGLDPGEDPASAVAREVHEETGHRLSALTLVDVDSTHFVARAPSGRLEDFHGVGVIYLAAVEAVLEPRVLDVGGSTSAAAWVPLADLAQLRLTTSLPGRIARALAHPGSRTVGG